MNRKTKRPEEQIKYERLRAELELPKLIEDMEKRGTMNEIQNHSPTPENNRKTKLLRIKTGYNQHASLLD